MTEFTVIMFGGIVLILYFIAQAAMNDFRANVKNGDVVGVDFGYSKVLNRTVMDANKEKVIVWDPTMTFKIGVERELLFISDSRLPADQHFSTVTDSF